MAKASKSNGSFSVTAYAGDAKTLLAFNLKEADARNLSGFTIQYTANGESYYIQNQLQFQDRSKHAQDPKEPANSSINAPIHKFRWVHVPGSAHQGLKPFMGKYTYTVTPRYFDANSALKPLDPKLSVSVEIDVLPFTKGVLRLGFARGFTQSQAFVRHFGHDALIRPKGDDLLFNTADKAGTNEQGQSYTYADEYEWLGFTARAMVFDLLNQVLDDKTLHLDMFAYDLNEPDLCKVVLELAKQGRVRVILDNASLHHNAKAPEPEDRFEAAFINAQTGPAAIKRGKFGRYAHDKVFIVSNAGGPFKVLTGSTNFSVTGIYVNSNHVIVFDRKEIATFYQEVFNESWKGDVKKAAFLRTGWAGTEFCSPAGVVPVTGITFSPHTPDYAKTILQNIANRVQLEGAKKIGGNVLFAVMQMDKGSSPVYDVLNNIHQNQSIFSFGISDGPKGIYLHKPGTTTGILVSGKPGTTVLPPPFDQVPSVEGHQVHHKFVVCAFDEPDAVVYCGSSNLANGGEEENGDNLITIRDADVATAFAIEALGLVDHFHFLDKCATGGKGSTPKEAGKTKRTTPPATPQEEAVNSGWFLSTDDHWTIPYYDRRDLSCVDRLLFGGG